MRGTGGHRRPKDSFAHPQPPAPAPLFLRPSRDSDASVVSSRPSSVGLSRASAAAATFDLYKDHRYQVSAVATIDAYLSSHTSISLHLPFPTAKDITQTLSFLMSRLDFPTTKVDEDLPLLLKILNYPFKLNKSILRSPGTPHQWPTFLAIIHWLVQAAMGERPAGEWMEKLERERENAAAVVVDLESQAVEIGSRIKAMQSEPSKKKPLEKEKGILEEDVVKFNEMIEKLREKIAELERDLERREKALEEKVAEKDRVCKENEELRKRVETQTVKSRDVERMRRELQAVERDIGDAEMARNLWEEQSWDLDATLGQKLKEIEALAMECNQGMRRLKFGDGFQYALNAKGSTPAEVMGIDYKSTLKAPLASFAEDLKKNSMAKLEEFIPLQQESNDIANKVEGKRNHLARLESRINEVETKLHLLRKETQAYTSKCAADAKRMVEELEVDAHNLDIVERDAADIKKASELKLQEAIKQNETEIQLCAQQFIALVDSVSKYKEYVQSKLMEMKNDLSETVTAVSDAYKGSWQPK
ncbi:hypothetical protein L484_024151 [Morus notabilis]|uniref:Kinetochore protein NDC80 n=1 Tax=Morus notabilis TaxID=981085 RepID=W9RXN1_9ROSA|nr:hypothetical protein L484_024151 [Morus notabilis]